MNNNDNHDDGEEALQHVLDDGKPLVRPGDERKSCGSSSTSNATSDDDDDDDDEEDLDMFPNTGGTVGDAAYYLRRLGVPPSLIDEVEQAGRDSDVSLVGNTDRANGLRIIFGGGQGTWGVRIAREHLAVVLSSIGNQFHHLDMIKNRNYTTAIDTQLCKAIQSGLKNFKELEISYLDRWNDSEVNTLLKHMPSGLSKLTMYEPGAKFPPSFRQIPLLMPDLKALELQGEHRTAIIGSQFLEEWAALIGLSPSLESLAFDDIVCSKEEDWNPVLMGIQKHANLKEVHFSRLYTPDGDAFEFDEEIADSMLRHLAINKAKAQLKLGDANNDGPTLENWVNVVISCRHNIACLDYLLSTVDPNLYAPAAIQGSTNNKRKVEQALGSEKDAYDGGHHGDLKQKKRHVASGKLSIGT